LLDIQLHYVVVFCNTHSYMSETWERDRGDPIVNQLPFH